MIDPRPDYDTPSPDTNEAIEPRPPITDEAKTAIHDTLVEAFDGSEPDVVFAFSAGIGKQKDGSYRSFPYSALSEHGIATGSRTRVIAASAIATSLPDVPIVTTSYNRFDPDEPTHASVQKAELVDRGVDEDRIVEETKSFSTITQLTEMIALSLEKGWKKIALLTNEYHEPRMRAMLENLEDLIVDAPDVQEKIRQFREAQPTAVFIPAEVILRQIHPLLEAYVGKVASTPQFQNTLETEAQGVRDIAAGRYRVVLKPERPRD